MDGWAIVAQSFVPFAGFSGVVIVAYLLSAYRKAQAACGLVDDSGADILARKAVLGRQEPVARY